MLILRMASGVESSGGPLPVLVLELLRRTVYRLDCPIALKSFLGSSTVARSLGASGRARVRFDGLERGMAVSGG
jgi:hypothetical protein